MTRPLERFARRLLGMRVLSAALLCALTFWFASMVGNFRIAHPYLGLALLPGLAFLGWSLLLLMYRLTTATPPLFLRPILDRAEALTLLIVVNLILINFLAPVLGIVLLVAAGNPLMRRFLSGLTALSGRLLVGLFVAGAVALICLIVVRLADQLVLRHAAARRLLRPLHYTLLVAIAAYCLYGLALIYNGGLDSSAAVEHRTEIAGVTRLPWVNYAWVALRSWDSPGQITRVFVFPQRDRLWPGLMGPGQPVLVRVRAGFLGIPWVTGMESDYTRHLDRLVEAAPSAAYPRKWLIQTLMKEQRWTDVVDQTEAYVRYYPGDSGYALRVAGALEMAGRRQEAAALRAGRPDALLSPPSLWLPAAAVPPNLAARTRPPDARPALPAPPAAHSEALAREMTGLSGLADHLQHLADRAQSQFEAYAWRAKNADRVRPAVRRAFHPDALAATAASVIARSLDRRHSDTLLDWLRSPLSRRITRLETDSATPAQRDNYHEFLTALPAAPPSPARISLVRRLDTSGDLTELNMETDLALRRSVRRMLAPLLPPSKPRADPDEDADLLARPAAEERTRFATVTTAVFAYQSLSDDELGAYVQFWQSPAGLWFMQVYRQALLEAIQAAADEAAAAAKAAAAPSPAPSS